NLSHNRNQDLNLSHNHNRNQDLNLSHNHNRNQDLNRNRNLFRGLNQDLGRSRIQSRTRSRTRTRSRVHFRSRNHRRHLFHIPSQDRNRVQFRNLFRIRFRNLFRGQYPSPAAAVMVDQDFTMASDNAFASQTRSWMLAAIAPPRLKANPVDPEMESQASIM